MIVLLFSLSTLLFQCGRRGFKNKLVQDLGLWWSDELYTAILLEMLRVWIVAE